MPARFPTPQGHGSRLIVPGYSQIVAAVSRNQQLFDSSTLQVDGIPLKTLREEFRHQFSLYGPVFVTGHQPELFHPGVWAKNFAASYQAELLNGVAVNLVVDNDEIKTHSIRRPCPHPDPNLVHWESIPFDVGGTSKPYETTKINDESVFRTFCERFGLKYTPGQGPGDVFTQARKTKEKEWGCPLEDIKVSELVVTPAFQHFVKHLLNNAERFRNAYNQAIVNYRLNHKLKSHTHPAPFLEAHESPFWLWNDNGERRPCPNPYHGDVSRLRPRAITLTLFSRLILADLFIHGIGGGKYDEMTDELFVTFFNIQPPTFQVVSGTLHLPLEPFPHNENDVRNGEHKLRDMYWNPERHGQTLLVAKAKRDLQREAPTTKAGRKQQYKQFREMNTYLRQGMEGKYKSIQAEIAVAKAEVKANSILQSRECAWVLYPPEELKRFLLGFMKS